MANLTLGYGPPIRSARRLSCRRSWPASCAASRSDGSYHSNARVDTGIVERAVAVVGTYRRQGVAVVVAILLAPRAENGHPREAERRGGASVRAKPIHRRPLIFYVWDDRDVALPTIEADVSDFSEPDSHFGRRGAVRTANETIEAVAKSLSNTGGSNIGAPVSARRLLVYHG
jgi:hypothetical protein